MPADAVSGAGHMPRPGRYLIPGDVPRRGELIAACAVLAVVAHLLFAQLTLILAVAFVIITRLSRWRPGWLAVPAAVGLIWVLAIGRPRPLRASPRGRRRSRPTSAGSASIPAGSVTWARPTPHRPLAAAAVSAGAHPGGGRSRLCGLAAWLHTDEWKLPGYRPGLITWCRRAYLTRFISSGGVVTRDGACLGLNAATGWQVAVSWAEVAGGVLCAGSPGSGTTTTSFPDRARGHPPPQAGDRRQPERQPRAG